MKRLSNQWKRVVVKVGSSLIAPEGNRCSAKYLLALAEYIQQCHANEKEVVIISSGGVAAGAGIASVVRSQELTIPQKQALAAIGQSRLMQHWQRFFDRPCAQILLTRSDLESKKRLTNAENTLEQLFELGAIPIINENDSVVVDELVVGDNDNLAARVAVMCNADRLIICSDVDGLFDQNPVNFPEAKLLKSVPVIDQSILDLASDSHNPIGTGGMVTKLEAAQYANKYGIETLIINGRNAESFELLKADRNPGTIFSAVDSQKLILKTNPSFVRSECSKSECSESE